MPERKPDVANQSELSVIHAALRHAYDGLEQARKAVGGLRPSDDYARALHALKRARLEIDRILSEFD